MKRRAERCSSFAKAALVSLLSCSIMSIDLDSASAAEGSAWTLKEVKIHPSEGAIEWEGYQTKHNASVTKTTITHSCPMSEWWNTSSGPVKFDYAHKFAFTFYIPETLVPGTIATLKASVEGRLSGNIPTQKTLFNDSVQYSLVQTDPWQYLKIQGSSDDVYFTASGPPPGPISKSHSVKFVVPPTSVGRIVIKAELNSRVLVSLRRNPR